MTTNNTEKPAQAKLWTNKLFFISGIIMAITFLIAINLGSTLLTFCRLLSIGFSLSGAIVGFIELKNNNSALLGMIGNLVLVILFIFLVLSSIKAPEIATI